MHDGNLRTGNGNHATHATSPTSGKHPTHPTHAPRGTPPAHPGPASPANAEALASPEVLTPAEAARWFKRSPSWLRAQRDLLRLKSPRGQPRYHLRVCRAYMLGKMTGVSPQELRRMQIEALVV